MTQVEFRANHDNSFITVLVPKPLATILSKRQKEALSQQLEAVFGINGYYVQEVKDEMLIPPPRSKTCHIDSKEKPIDILETGSKLDTTSENTAWNQIRKGLIEELGETIDTVWFSKAEATKCSKTNTLTIIMPTRFMSDWIRNNYYHVIRRVASSQGNCTKILRLP